MWARGSSAKGGVEVMAMVRGEEWARNASQRFVVLREVRGPVLAGSPIAARSRRRTCTKCVENSPVHRDSQRVELTRMERKSLLIKKGARNSSREPRSRLGVKPVVSDLRNGMPIASHVTSSSPDTAGKFLNNLRRERHEREDLRLSGEDKCAPVPFRTCPEPTL